MSNSTSIAQFFNGIISNEDIATIALKTAANGNPFNSANKYTNFSVAAIGTKANGNPLATLFAPNNAGVPTAPHGLVKLYGKDIVKHLRLNKIQYVATDNIKATKNKQDEKAVTAFLHNFTKLCMSQKTEGDSILSCPVKPAQEFVALAPFWGMQAVSVPANLAGWDLISAVGDNLTGKAINKTEMRAVEVKIAAFFNVAVKDVKYALGTAAGKNQHYSKASYLVGMQTYFLSLTRPDLTFLVDKHVYDFMVDTFDNSVSTNVIAVNSGWTDYMKFRATHEHVYLFCQNLVANIPTDPASRKKPLTAKLVSGKDTSPTNFRYELTFEEAYTIVITHEGVFEKDRRRSLYSQIVVNQQALTYCKGDLQDEDMYLRNHYGVLLQYLVMNALQFTLVDTRLASFYSKKVAIELPWVAEEDQGPVDGDRNALQRSTCTTVTSQDFVEYKYGANGHVDFSVHSSTPFIFTNVKGDVNLLGTRKYYQFKQTGHAAYRVDHTAFTALNLVRNKENFVDGRRVALQCRHIPKEYRTLVIQIICACAFKCEGAALDAAVIADFKLEAAGYTHEELWGFIANDLVIGLSSKLSKLVKRAVMYAAQIGRITGGESRSLRQYGQKEVSNNCAAVKAIIGICTNAAPGMAEFYRDDLVTMEVERTADRTFNVKAYQVNGVIPLEWGDLPAPDKTAMDGLYRVYTWTPGIALKMGQTICSLPYYLDNKVGSEVKYAEVRNEYESAHLQEVRIRFVRYGASWQAELDYTVVTYETTIKVRGILKAMAIRADESSVNNGLNAYEGIAFDADALFHRDTNKWLDTTHGLLDCIYMTARKNPNWVEANQTIAAIDAAIGVDKTWAPVLDLMGIYDNLRQMFYAKFGKMFWVQHEEHNTCVETSAILLQYHMYRNADGWQKLSGVPANMLAMLPAGFTRHVCLVQTQLENPTWDAIKDTTENVLIFGFNEDNTSFYQAHRSFVYVGTAECPLYMPVKGEMASVGSLVGTTKMMQGCIRNIAVKDPVFANLCVKANFSAYDKYAAFLAMANSKEIIAKNGVAMKTIYLNSIDEEDNVWLTPSAKSLLCNEKIAAIYAATKSTGTFLKALAQEFGNTRFVIKTNESVKVDIYDTNPNAKTEFKQNEFSLYLPVIVAQSSAAGYKHTDDMSSNVQALFTYLHQGQNWVKYTDDGVQRNGYIHNLCARIRGAIIGLTRSETVTKCAAFGPLGVQGKPTALYGVRLDEVYVRKSDKFDSVYQTMLRTYKLKPSELAGHPIVFSRSPMTATAKLRIIVIKDNHWAASYVPIHSFVMNPLTCYYHRGDYDGDLNALFSAIIDGIECTLPYLTNTLLIQSIIDSTGKNHLQPGGSYYGDGFEIPTLAAVYKKMEFKPSSLTLLSSKKNMLDPYSTDKAALGQLLAGSTKMLKEAVGNIHRVWITNDIFISAMTELTEVLAATKTLATAYHPELFIGLVQILAEIYEVPLGGYDEWAYIVFYKHLFNKDAALNEAAVEGMQNLNNDGEVIDMSLDTLGGVMDKAGMNGLTQYAVTGEAAGDRVVNIPLAVTKAVELSEYVNGDVTKQIGTLYPLSWDAIVTKLSFYKAVEFFLLVTSYIGVNLSKGLLDPSLVKTGTATVVNYEDDYGEGELAAPVIPVDKQAIDLYRKGVVGLGLTQEFLDNSVMFSGIEYFIDTVVAAMNDKAVTIDTAFFYKEKAAVEVIDQDAIRAGISLAFNSNPLTSPLEEVIEVTAALGAVVNAGVLTAKEVAAQMDLNFGDDDVTVATVTKVATLDENEAVADNDPDGVFAI